jgi:hypothetical protein
MRKAKRHSAPWTGISKPQDDVVSLVQRSCISCLQIGFRGLARTKKPLYTPFLRHYGGYRNHLSVGFPVEKQAEIRIGLRKISAEPAEMPFRSAVFFRAMLVMPRTAIGSQAQLLDPDQVDEYQHIDQSDANLHPGEAMDDLKDLPRQE